MEAYSIRENYAYRGVSFFRRRIDPDRLARPDFQNEPRAKATSKSSPLRASRAWSSRELHFFNFSEPCFFLSPALSDPAPVLPLCDKSLTSE